ncbi:2-amino-4-hydroxy-6-hydroxymethyldihydropteridine diphosphokinase [Oceanibaculum indicum]|uniref:2-amino-4-hydroxy-6-hydroxymethyldihydropteridine pyrophosphokinase n=1 Tax=Oceanibaculum indicum TaxID=526216 RepID=A0A420WPD9_9PROT|nr:2-amino-4-hydroxy-6-hydroxymethyldihydropteridine diphosphokinase [Oceanibaculum indicum]RKQ72911.1 2-amino-4-hydroxy-6-hydroxymethyldihydropteridine diphosphokinase [Oceanibaculum indicum]
MILVAIGSNLPGAGFDTPRAVCLAALEALERDPDIRVVARSRLFESAPVPLSDQPWYANGAVLVETALPPAALLARLHEIEAQFGRVRQVRNEARVLDLDLLAYHDVQNDRAEVPPLLPHPRLRERAFVLRPLLDIARDWRHPGDSRDIPALLAALPPGQALHPIRRVHG